MKLPKAMENKVSEYRDKTGKEMDDVPKTVVLHGAMDMGSKWERGP